MGHKNWRGKTRHEGKEMIGIWNWATNKSFVEECQVCGVRDRHDAMVSFVNGDHKTRQYWSETWCQNCWGQYAGDFT